MARMMSLSRDATQPRRIPASEYALDMDPVLIAFSYPKDRMLGGISSSASPWKRGRYTSSENTMMSLALAKSTTAPRTDLGIVAPVGLLGLLMMIICSLG